MRDGLLMNSNNLILQKMSKKIFIAGGKSNPRIKLFINIDLYSVLNFIKGLPLYIIKLPWGLLMILFLLIHCDFTQEFDRKFLAVETVRWLRFWK